MVRLRRVRREERSSISKSRRLRLSWIFQLETERKWDLTSVVYWKGWGKNT